MHALPRRQFLALGVAAAFALQWPVGAFADNPAPAAKTRAVFQVSDADPQKWNLTLANVANAQEALGKDAAEIEIVAFGPGIDMLRKDSPVAARVAEALRSGVRVVACQNTMRARKLAPADMLPEIGAVPSGVVEIMQRQRDGYAYLRS
jgi:intracellular sulfur oxidation DsrE/DsrF family protein